MRKIAALALAVGLVVAACSGDDDGDSSSTTAGGDDATSAGGYEATIRRTSFGIPHVVADDYGSLGFGQGYAAAEDHACDIADQVVKVRSERASFFGPGEEDAHVNSDFAYLALGLYERAQDQYDRLPERERDVIDGYAAGYNAFLDETGVDAVPGWCGGEPWLRPISGVDLLAYYRELLLLASGRQFVDYIATAAPPAAASTATDTATDTTAAAAPAPGELPDLTPEVASNGWAIGADMAADGTGLLLANPHFPWEGELRLWEVQLTIPGEMDVYGAALHGVAGVLIGFNDAVAWTHTVSAGHRFTAYRLDLAPGDPTSYLYDGEPRAMESEELTVDVLGDDGATAPQSRTMWRTHYGPVINFPGVGWTDETTITFRDANIDNEAFLTQFLGMDSATTFEEFQQVHEETNGIPWVNTMAVSAEGEAWYADTAATPNLSQEAQEAWRASLDTDAFVKIAYDNGAILLDGSDSMFEWQEAPGARSAGLVPFSEQPKLTRSDYIFNANDSYWLANPDELITGHSPMHGLEATARSPRTRMNVVAIEEGSGDDGKYTLDELTETALSNRALTAELLKDDLVATVCGEEPNDEIADACGVLAEWDGRFDLDSVGAGLWRLFIGAYEWTDLTGAGALFAEPFDATDPVGTPRTGAFTDPAHAQRAMAALTQATADLRAAGFDVDTPYGEIQYTERAGERIPIHGGPGDQLGITNAIGFSRFSTTLEPGLEPGEPVRDGVQLSSDGWAVNNGSSFVMALEFGADGPRARAFLTYSQSSDPESDHYADQTQRFSAKEWRDILVTDEAIDADPELREYTVEGER